MGRCIISLIIVIGSNLIVMLFAHALPPFSPRPTDGKPLRRSPPPQGTAFPPLMDMQALLGLGTPSSSRNDGRPASPGRPQVRESSSRPSATQYRETFAQIGLTNIGNSCAAWEKLYKRQQAQPERYKLTSLEGRLLKRINANCQAMYVLAEELNLALVEYRGYMYTAFLETQTARNYQGLQKMMASVQRQEGIATAPGAPMPLPTSGSAPISRGLFI